MSADLAELKERIAYSRTEIATLEKEVIQFCADGIEIVRKPVGWAIYSDLRSANRFDIYLRQSRTMPMGIASKAGMIANELRSCLDGLACALAERHSGSSKNTYFPISKSKQIFDDDGMRKIRLLSPSDQQAIIRLEPYLPNNVFLFGLHEADRTRKHIRLTAVAGCADHAAVNVGAIGVVSMGGGGSVQLTNVVVGGVPIQSMRIGPGEPVKAIEGETLVISGAPAGVQTSITRTVAYAEPKELEGCPLVQTLNTFADKVTEIVALF